MSLRMAIGISHLQILMANSESFALIACSLVERYWLSATASCSIADEFSRERPHGLAQCSCSVVRV